MSDVQAVSPSTAAKSATMPKITFIEHDGTVHTVEAETGATVGNVVGAPAAGTPSARDSRT